MTTTLHTRHFHGLEVGECPPHVGLYAWYGRFYAGKKAWTPEVIDGQDVAIQRTRTLLANFTARFAAPSLKAECKGPFNSLFGGELDDRSTDSLQATLRNTPEAGRTDYDKKRTPRLQHSVEKPNLRETLVSILGDGNPLVSAPLYIGVSDDLNARLCKHIQQVEKYAPIVADDREKRQRLQSDKTFGARAASMGFNVDSLEAWVIDLSETFPSHARDELREVAYAAEWLLNRWHRPLLGRR